ncbi:type II toxin-antitoxin system RelE/ParE family toxin [Klebsiella oxytoca]|uniref:type II toxin-antitoxin system RelE/ParE family toxin n=1 Tax=Klebsiella oxytoca TaxID=571 RepID=UPI00254D66D9|nr:type II toxin-antitoxin system RelE/ParE family toxin [Klebsiella oxytoca]MEC5509958.1 type II toxin-antitoxin system RelE/ParE family toxin [Klebsiella oxytoca]
MFEVIYHDEAEAELIGLPIPIRVKFDRLVKKLESDPRSLREPHTKPLGGGLYEIRTMGSDIARGLWVYQAGNCIYLLRIFIKKTPKTPPHEIELAWRRLEEMKREI